MVTFKKFFFHIALIILILQDFPSVYAHGKPNHGDHQSCDGSHGHHGSSSSSHGNHQIHSSVHTGSGSSLSSSGNAQVHAPFNATTNCRGAFSKVYAFGGSYSDPGNAFLMGMLKTFFNFLHPEDSSSGRLCNGKLVIDYLSEAFGIPPPPPYKNASADFSRGANFATSGSTVLPTNFFSQHSNIQNSLWKVIPMGIEKQMEWFNKFLQDAKSGGISGDSSFGVSGGISGGASGGSSSGSSSGGASGGSNSGSSSGSSGGVSGGSSGGVSGGSSGGSSGGISGGSSGGSSSGSSSGASGGSSGGASGGSGGGISGGSSSNLMDDALFWLGAVGATDYGLIGGSTSSDWLANHAVNITCNMLKRVIDAGAKYIVVQGLPPIGCLPLKLSLTLSTDRDNYGCCASANTAISKHNQLLQQALTQMQNQYKECTIVFADFAKAYLTILSHYGDFHFTEAFKACCGFHGNPFNFDIHHPCGSLLTLRCGNAGMHMVWDGIHFTTDVYKLVAQMFLSQNGFTTPCLADVIKKKMGM